MTKSTTATVGSVASLTGHLTKATNPVRAFLGNVLPAESAKPFNDAIRSQLGAGPRVAAATLAPWEHSLIGTAFDYRMRYWFDVPTTKPLVAAYGLLTLDPVATNRVQPARSGRGVFRGLLGFPWVSVELSSYSKSGLVTCTAGRVREPGPSWFPTGS